MRPVWQGSPQGLLKHGWMRSRCPVPCLHSLAAITYRRVEDINADSLGGQELGALVWRDHCASWSLASGLRSRRW